MSLYSSGFLLLPRPPRSILSMGNDSTRATLPDFASVKELSQFTSRHFNWYIPIPSLYTQALCASGLCYIMIIAASLTLARNIYQGKFWLVRVIRKPKSVIAVPNPIIAFLVLMGLYGLLFTPLFLLLVRDFMKHTGPPRHIILTLTVSVIHRAL